MVPKLSRVACARHITLPYLKRCNCIYHRALFLSFPFPACRARCLIVTRFRRKVTPGANQPMNSGLTTELLTARVRAWKRVMNRLIPFHSQSRNPASPSCIHSLPSPIPRPPFLPDRATHRRHAVIENWLPQTTLHFVSVAPKTAALNRKPLVPSPKLYRRDRRSFFIYVSQIKRVYRVAFWHIFSIIQQYSK